jgi:RNase H-fold protein (predicted Holliday junction resolvase)
MKEKKEEFYILGLDVSTKTIGISLFNQDGVLMELTHISPKIKPVPPTKTEELIKKAILFSEFLDNYTKLNIKYVVIEEPLLRSNNVNTVGTLLRFNGMITKIVYDKLKVTPEYISSYESRKNAFPELMQPNASKKIVLFGSYPKDIDKKKVVWEKVSEREPNIKWIINKNGDLAKENYDMSDAFACGHALLRLKGLIT